MTLHKIYQALKLLLHLPPMLPLLVIYLLAPRDHVFHADLARWAMIREDRTLRTLGQRLGTFIRYFAELQELRTVFYYRFRWAKPFQWLLPPMPTLYLYTPVIGPGIFIQHGFATVIAAKSIGKNCWINQQVTIGYVNTTDAPYIGDDVIIYAGAMVFGDIHVGDGAVVGANAVVGKNVPADCVVGGVPASILKRNGVRVNERLD